jgi:FkbM family methyltransferase
LKKLVATLLLASRVRPSIPFVRRQRRGEPGEHEYEIRATGRRALIRHDSDDPHVLAETFGRLAQYEPPPPLAEELERRPPRSVVDLGANVGLFGLLALDRFPGCEVVGFEADPGNAAIHERVIERNGLGDRWSLVHAFAATAPGSVRFAAGRSSRSRAAAETDAGAIEVEALDAFPRLERADLVKIDVEGAEWELLADPRFASIPARAVVLEYHGAGCPSADPHAAAAEALERAGFGTLQTARSESPADEQEGLGTIWGWKTAA